MEFVLPSDSGVLLKLYLVMQRESRRVNSPWSQEDAVSINIYHPISLMLPVIIIVLYSAQSIDPDPSLPQVESKINGMLHRLWEMVIWNTLA